MFSNPVVLGVVVFIVCALLIGLYKLFKPQASPIELHKEPPQSQKLHLEQLND
jgi:hypothetical protein